MKKLAVLILGIGFLASGVPLAQAYEAPSPPMTMPVITGTADDILKPPKTGGIEYVFWDVFYHDADGKAISVKSGSTIVSNSLGRRLEVDTKERDLFIWVMNLPVGNQNYLRIVNKGTHKLEILGSLKEGPCILQPGESFDVKGPDFGSPY